MPKKLEIGEFTLASFILGSLILGIFLGVRFGHREVRPTTPLQTSVTPAVVETEKPAPVTTPNALERALKAQTDARKDQELQRTLGITYPLEPEKQVYPEFLRTIASDQELCEAVMDLKKKKIRVYAQNNSRDPDREGVAGSVDTSGQFVFLFTNANHAQLRQFLLGHQ